MEAQRALFVRFFGLGVVGSGLRASDFWAGLGFTTGAEKLEELVILFQ